MSEVRGRHCDRCRFVNWAVFYTLDGKAISYAGCCPMPNACRTCDEIESEHDETLVLPRMVAVEEDE